MYDKALILSLGKFREYDMWVRLLTRQSGICTVFAFGASRSRRRFTGCLDFLNVIYATIEKSNKKDFLQLKETTLETNFDLRKDWRLVGIATNCIRFTEALNISPETSIESYDFIYSFLNLLVPYHENLGNANLLPPLFRFKLASIQGYAPHIHSCVRCNSNLKDDRNVFAVHEGGILCYNCAHNSLISSSMHINLSQETLEFLQKVQFENVNSWLSQTVPQNTVNQYGKITDAFVHYHLGLEWQRNKFIHI